MKNSQTTFKFLVLNLIISSASFADGPANEKIVKAIITKEASSVSRWYGFGGIETKIKAFIDKTPQAPNAWQLCYLAGEAYVALTEFSNILTKTEKALAVWYPGESISELKASVSALRTRLKELCETEPTQEAAAQVALAAEMFSQVSATFFKDDRKMGKLLFDDIAWEDGEIVINRMIASISECADKK